MNNNEKEKYELISRLVSVESEINNIKNWDEHQNKRIDKVEQQFNSKIQKLEDKIDKIIDNEKQLLATINDSDSSLDDKINERFNKLQAWLLGTAATAGLGLLMFILENVLDK